MATLAITCRLWRRLSRIQRLCRRRHRVLRRTRHHPDRAVDDRQRLVFGAAGLGPERVATRTLTGKTTVHPGRVDSIPTPRTRICGHPLLFRISMFSRLSPGYIAGQVSHQASGSDLRPHGARGMSFDAKSGWRLRAVTPDNFHISPIDCQRSVDGG